MCLLLGFAYNISNQPPAFLPTCVSLPAAVWISYEAVPQGGF